MHQVLTRKPYELQFCFEKVLFSFLLSFLLITVVHYTKCHILKQKLLTILGYIITLVDV